MLTGNIVPVLITKLQSNSHLLGKMMTARQQVVAILVFMLINGTIYTLMYHSGKIYRKQYRTVLLAPSLPAKNSTFTRKYQFDIMETANFHNEVILVWSDATPIQFRGSDQTATQKCDWTEDLEGRRRRHDCLRVTWLLDMKIEIEF
ncbi:uncharacterized protein LOC118437430 [Folsomia candida]|uniref:uncharacterized protein LOC118437430 n=1 Tax=Folsomia candida TaxID=158441 RepID=UPI001604F6BE|nr:uncharacterized protein LOC118437430 [Folsomia candida]